MSAEGEKAILNQLKQIDRGRPCLKFEQINIGDGAAVTLNPPSHTFSAIFTIEADLTALKPERCVRFTEDSTTPTSTVGFPLGDGDVYEITHILNISNFKIIGIEAGKTHKLNVHYYQQS